MGSTSSLSSSSGSVRVLKAGHLAEEGVSLLEGSCSNQHCKARLGLKIEDEHKFFIFIRLAAVLTIAYVHISQFSTRFFNKTQSQIETLNW